jgi:hypothetical protein
MSKAGFRITKGSGFHITFDNGYTVSVQFGAGAFCDNMSIRMAQDLLERKFMFEVNTECADAEVAVIKDNELVPLPQFDGDVIGRYYSPEQVLKLLNWASKQKGKS